MDFFIYWLTLAISLVSVLCVSTLLIVVFATFVYLIILLIVKPGMKGRK